MAALNSDQAYIYNGYATNITVAAIKDNVMSIMPLSFVTGALEQTFINNGARVLTEGVNPIENNNGVEIEYLDVEQVVVGVKVAQRIVVFQSNETLIMITITVPQQFKDEILPVSEPVGKSIKLLNH